MEEGSPIFLFVFVFLVVVCLFLFLSIPYLGTYFFLNFLVKGDIETQRMNGIVYSHINIEMDWKVRKKINYADYEEEVLSRVTIMEVLSMGDDSSILWDIWNWVGQKTAG